MSQTEFTKRFSYQELLGLGKRALQEVDIMDAQIDSWYLLEFVTGMNRSQFFLKSHELALLEEQKRYFDLIQLRKNHIPLQHLTGEQEFMGLSFLVNENVLVPRQDTECLVELALNYVEDKSVLDMCTGSGCIAISLQYYGKPRKCCGVDLSVKALEVARQNADRNHVNVTFIESNLFDHLSEKYDVIVSNPPYIPPRVIDGLMEEVREYEPRMALDGGEDGLDFYRQITIKAKDFLNEGGYLFYEIGCEQAEDVINLMQDAGYIDVFCKKDYAGNDRVVFGKYI